MKELKNIKWHSMSSVEALRELEAGPAGLTESEALKRLERFGKNELEKGEKISPFALFIDQFKDVLIIILIIATVLSLLVGETVDAIIIAVIVIFSALLGFMQEYKAEKAMEALKGMLHATITLRREGRDYHIDSSFVVPGDIMLLEAGDKVPADARLIETALLRCDESSLTGESMPVKKVVDAIDENASLADRVNMVFTGSIITYGRGVAVVTSTAMDTEFGQIAKVVSSVKSEKTPLEIRTEEIGKWMGIIAIGICGFVIGISILREFLEGTLSIDSSIKMVMFGVALAVAAVPEALAAIVTGALAIGMREMAKKGALIRKMPAVETLGCTTVICSDKTGTLTRGEMTARKIYAAGQYVDIEGAGYVPEGNLSVSDEQLAILAPLFKGCVLCNDSSVFKLDGKWRMKGDPTEAALVVMAQKAGLDPGEVRSSYSRVVEIPFSSERKRMSTVNVESGTHVAYVKGAPEVVLGLCDRALGAGGETAGLAEQERADILSAAEGMASDALRVLAIAYKSVDVLSEDEEQIEDSLIFAGLVGMMDPPRPEATEAVRVCKSVHMKPVMITGDHKVTAMAVAREMGIYEEGHKALTGPELEAMSDEEFESIVGEVTVYARVSPMDKLKIVKAWQKTGEIVAMTGDGVNDAPALKQADIGIAMGITGTEVAKEAADMVLSDDNFATIVSAIERGRWIYDNIKKYLSFLLQCNITEVLVIGGIVLWLGPHYLPLLPAAILYVNLATDGLPALALGVAPPDSDIMQRPPRNPKESVFSSDVISFLIRAVILEFPLFVWIYSSSLPDLELARTRIFFMFIVIELVIALNCRSLRFSVFKSPPHKWLIIAIAWEIVLIVVLMQIPQMRESFGVSIPTLPDLTMIFALGFIVFAVMEAMKWMIGQRARRKGVS